MAHDVYVSIRCATTLQTVLNGFRENRKIVRRRRSSDRHTSRLLLSVQIYIYIYNRRFRRHAPFVTRFRRQFADAPWPARYVKISRYPPGLLPYPITPALWKILPFTFRRSHDVRPRRRVLNPRSATRYNNDLLLTESAGGHRRRRPTLEPATHTHTRPLSSPEGAKETVTVCTIRAYRVTVACTGKNRAP